MIEVEQQRIGLPTVATWMGLQESMGQLTTVPLVSLALFTGSRDVQSAITAIVLPSVAARAVDAIRLAGSASPVLQVKVRERAQSSAQGTSTRFGHVSGRGSDAESGFGVLGLLLCQPNWRAVRARWQFAHRTSHLSISRKTLCHGRSNAIRVTPRDFVAGSRWSKSSTTMSVSPQSTHGCVRR